MLKIIDLVSLNITENGGGALLSNFDLKQTKYKYLKKQFIGLSLSAKHASRVFRRDNKQVTIHCYFTKEDEINAYVSRLRTEKKQRYLIVLHTGIFFKVQSLFLYLMSSNDILPHLKTKSKRNEYALLLTSFAVEFLFFHEMTHIDHGHLDYLKSRNNKFDVLRSTESSNELIPANLPKVLGLENEADIGAAEYIYDSYWDLAYPGTMMKKFSKLLKTKKELVFAISFSLIWLFHLMQDYRDSLGQSIAGSHPSPGCRILSVFRIFYVLAGKKNGDQALIIEEFKSAMVAYIVTCKKIGIRPHFESGVFQKNSQEENELNQVESFRLHVQHELRSFHFGRVDQN